MSFDVFPYSGRIRTLEGEQAESERQAERECRYVLEYCVKVAE